MTHLVCVSDSFRPFLSILFTATRMLLVVSLEEAARSTGCSAHLQGLSSTRWARTMCHTELSRDRGDPPLLQPLILENCSAMGLTQP